MFHFLFPSLLLREEPYIVTMQTPIVKILNKNILFYREEHYQKYIENNEQNLKIKYYKGLGTNSDKEIKETFINRFFQPQCIKKIQRTKTNRE